MNYYTKEDLISAIDDATPLCSLSIGEESSVIISEYGGRPLGFFPKNDSYSLLWINPEIKQKIQAKDRSIGGDRYWISPERNFFYKDPENWEGWFCPPGLDPADYKTKNHSNHSCSLHSPFSVIDQVENEEYLGEITRQFTVIKDPFNTRLAYCGLEFREDCTFFKPSLDINGWSLATIISGGKDNPGTVFIPTKENPIPLSYFRPIPDDRVNIGENHVSFKIDVNDIYKLAIRPEDLDFDNPAKIGYILRIPESDEYGFLVKLSDDIPMTQQDCFDVARDHPDSEIGVIQSYNSESPDKSQLRYGEIELQLNRFKTVGRSSQGKATHQLLGYIGKKKEILEVVETILDISNPQLF